MSEQHISLHVWIEGRVQGVFFRDWIRGEAQARNVTGWVRNTSDGRVEGVFEGNPAAVQALLDACKEGPPSAHVSHIETQPEPASGEYRDFSILW